MSERVVLTRELEVCVERGDLVVRYLGGPLLHVSPWLEVAVRRPLGYELYVTPVPSAPSPEGKPYDLGEWSLTAAQTFTIRNVGDRPKTQTTYSITVAHKHEFALQLHLTSGHDWVCDLHVSPMVYRVHVLCEEDGDAQTLR